MGGCGCGCVFLSINKHLCMYASQRWYIVHTHTYTQPNTHTDRSTEGAANFVDSQFADQPEPPLRAE